MSTKIDVIILARDEEMNLPRALESAKQISSRVFVVDSGSADRTRNIAKQYGAEFISHADYENQAQQFNWALDHLPLEGEWVLRLDADEWLTPELANEIREVISINQQNPHQSAAAVNGYFIKRRVYFMGRWIRHGGYYPTWILRLFRRGKARSEEREMDEHIVVEADQRGSGTRINAEKGKVGYLRHDFVDENRKGLAAWTAKHNDFSTREAQARLSESSASHLGGQAGRKRWMKASVYGRLPLFCRAFLYFIYRYFFRLGFLDGIPGLIFHFLQGFWHQFLIDAKIYETRHTSKD